MYSEAFEEGVNYAIEKMFSKNPAKKIAKNQKKKDKKIQERQANENSAFHDNPSAGLNGSVGNTSSNTNSAGNTGSTGGSNTDSKTSSNKQKNIFKKIGNYVKEHPVKTGLGVAGTAGLAFTGYKLATRKRNGEDNNY